MIARVAKATASLALTLMLTGSVNAWASQAGSGGLGAQRVLTPIIDRGGEALPAPRFTVLRPRDPQAYATEKAAADRAYHDYAAVQAPSSSTGSSPFSSSLDPLVSLNQPGLVAADGGGSTPPDSTGAIGPNYYIEFVNSRIQVYSRLLTTKVATATEDSFTGSTSTCDGQIKWDQQAQRWEYWSLDCGLIPGQEGWSFGWSKTADPTNLAGGWCKYHRSTGITLDDYGKLGNDDAFMIVGTNQFSDATLGYTGSELYAIAKPANGTTTCPSSPAVTSHSLNDAFTPEPANVYGSSASGYAVAVNNAQNGLRLYKIVGGSGSTPSFIDRGTIGVPAFSVPAGVPQPGSSDLLDSSDTRLTQAVAAPDPSIGGALGIWTQHTIAGAGGGPSVVRWYEIRDGPALVQSGTIQAASGNFAFNAAISPTTTGHSAAISYDIGGSAQLVQVRAQGHQPGAPAGTMSGETTLVTSSDIDADFSCGSKSLPPSGTPCRWGDYAGAGPDPNDANAVWGTNELNGAQAGGNAQWATQNFALALDEAPTASFSVTTASPSATHPVSFDGSASTDPDRPGSGNGISSYDWNWGDGSAHGSGATPSHAYSSPGTFTVTLAVTDIDGRVGYTWKQVTVDELPTAAFAVTTTSPTAGQPVAFDGSASIDPDCSVPVNGIYSYDWDWGDGTAHGSGATPSHTYATAGSYAVTLSVTDCSALAATVSHWLTVADAPNPSTSSTSSTSPASTPPAASAPPAPPAPTSGSGNGNGGGQPVTPPPAVTPTQTSVQGVHGVVYRRHRRHTRRHRPHHAKRHHAKGKRHHSRSPRRATRRTH